MCILCSTVYSVQLWACRSSGLKCYQIEVIVAFNKATTKYGRKYLLLFSWHSMMLQYNISNKVEKIYVYCNFQHVEHVYGIGGAEKFVIVKSLNHQICMNWKNINCLVGLVEVYYETRFFTPSMESNTFGLIPYYFISRGIILEIVLSRSSYQFIL
jgi:hypothetical protein